MKKLKNILIVLSISFLSLICVTSFIGNRSIQINNEKYTQKVAKVSTDESNNGIIFLEGDPDDGGTEDGDDGEDTCDGTVDEETGECIPRPDLTINIVKLGGTLIGNKYILYKAEKSDDSFSDSDFVCETNATDRDNASVPDAITDAEGNAKFEHLLNGTYCVTEDSSSKTQIVAIDASGDAKTVTFSTTSVGNIVIKKIDKTTKVPLKGASFRLYQSDGTTQVTTDAYGNNYGVVRTNEEGTASFQNVPYGKYIIKEIGTLSGYLVTNDLIEVNIDTTDAKSVTIETEPIQLTIIKKDYSTKSELAGATILIKNTSTEEEFKEYVTATNEFVLHVYPGEYVMKEIMAPDNYMINVDEVKFTVTSKGEITIDTAKSDLYETGTNTLTIYNEPLYTLFMVKDIASGDALKGVKFDVLDENGDVALDSLTDDEISFESSDGFQKFYLESGDYKIVQKSVNDGYELISDSMDFNISLKGDVTLAGTEDPYFQAEANRITVFNAKPGDDDFQIVTVPDTGAFVSIVSIIVGAAIIFFGIQVVKRKKQDKNLS